MRLSYKHVIEERERGREWDKLNLKPIFRKIIPMTANLICIRVSATWINWEQYGNGKIKNPPNFGAIQKMVVFQCVIWLMARIVQFSHQEFPKIPSTFMQRIFAGTVKRTKRFLLSVNECLVTFDFFTQFGSNSI